MDVHIHMEPTVLVSVHVYTIRVRKSAYSCIAFIYVHSSSVGYLRTYIQMASCANAHPNFLPMN